MSAGATYSTARIATGPVLFISGQTPAGPDGSTPSDVEEQTRLVLAKIQDVLVEHGCGWGDVVKVTYYLRDIADLDVVRTVIRDVVPEPRPAATLAQVSAFVDPSFAVEVDAVADLGNRP